MLHFEAMERASSLLALLEYRTEPSFLLENQVLLYHRRVAQFFHQGFTLCGVQHHHRIPSQDTGNNDDVMIQGTLVCDYL